MQYPSSGVALSETDPRPDYLNVALWTLHYGCMSAGPGGRSPDLPRRTLITPQHPRGLSRRWPTIARLAVQDLRPFPLTPPHPQSYVSPKHVCLLTQDVDESRKYSMQLPSNAVSSSETAAPQQTSAPGNSPQPSSQASTEGVASTGAWSFLQQATAGRAAERRGRSSPAQFRRHGPFQKAALPSVLWTLDPADDGGEMVAGVEAEALSAAKAIAAAARELASRALGFEL